jgi:hypothetical protein
MKLIAFFTNVFFFQKLDFAGRDPCRTHTGPLSVAAPVVGALITV